MSNSQYEYTLRAENIGELVLRLEMCNLTERHRLIGIVKNAIMMIDVALDAERREGMSSAHAIYTAAKLRFRPIMMTTMAAMLGGVPLAVGGGTGSELRRPLGITIVGGLIVSQMLTPYTTPVIYLYLDRFRLWTGRAFHRRGRSPVPETAL